MIRSIHQKQSSLAYKILCGFIALTFISGVVLPPGYAQAGTTILNLPVPGAMVTPSTGFVPARLIGVTVHPDNPLKFDFIVNTGDADLAPEALKEESRKLIKYFLASLTVPEDELWVNLSPYEKDRMIPQGLGQTEMGRDMLAQDYLLKQLTASLMYPEKGLGKKFWEKIYKEAREKYGTTEIPVNTFNKVWVVPQEAVVYEHEMSVPTSPDASGESELRSPMSHRSVGAFVVKSRLKVMLENDYKAMSHQDTKSPSHQDPTGDVVTATEGSPRQGSDVVTTSIIREVIIPAIEKEVNEGENFASLRQMYNSLILAAWYKLKLKDGLLGQVYVDKNKTKGIDTEDKQVNQKIYDQYIESFKKGVYNYIKEDYDPATQDMIPRKYFSGGFRFGFGKGIVAMVAASLMTWGTSLQPAPAADLMSEIKNGKNSSVEVVLGENPLKGVQETLAALEPPVSIDQERTTSDEQRTTNKASSPVGAVMKFLPDEIGRGVWGGNLFAWKFNSRLNRITGGNESDKFEIAKEMGDLVRILMSFEGRYHDFLEVLKVTKYKGRHFDTDGLVEGHRTRILGLLSISDTAKQALRNINVAQRIAKSVESQVAGEKIFQVPMSKEYRDGDLIVDVSLRVTDLVSLVEEITYKQQPREDFQVLVKELQQSDGLVIIITPREVKGLFTYIPQRLRLSGLKRIKPLRKMSKIAVRRTMPGLKLTSFPLFYPSSRKKTLTELSRWSKSMTLFRKRESGNSASFSRGR